MKARFLRFTCLILLAGLLTTPAYAQAADILDTYSVAIAPQSDGTLVMTYTLEHYCTYSDWPADQPYLQVGVPNGNFSITDWGPREGAHRVVNAEAAAGSLVQLNFDRSQLPRNGDCFDLYFTVTQGKMAYPDPETGNVTFKFIPAGWTFPIEVRRLTVTWAMPGDPALLKFSEPNPTGTDGAQMTWQWNNPAMNSASMFSGATIELAYDAAAFKLSEEATTPSEGGNEQLVISVGCVTLIIIVVAIVLLLILLIALAEGGFGGGRRRRYSRGALWGGGGLGSGSRSGGGRARSGGGLGGSSGHSSGCACAGCACACACAGGGKVGCSRKGIGIHCLARVINELA